MSGPADRQPPAVTIRDADPHRDAGACARVYAPHVTAGVASLEEMAPSEAEMAARIRQARVSHAWLVAQVGHAVAGYAYGSSHRTRAAYRWATDVTVYVDLTHHRQGLGRALYARLFELLAARGYYVACAGITLPNAASVALHEAMGFAPVGVYRRIGYKHGRWWDVGWWQRSLQEPGADAPAEPR